MTLACGDLNLTLEPEIDTYNYKHINNPLSCGAFLGTMSICNLKPCIRLPSAIPGSKETQLNRQD